MNYLFLALISLAYGIVYCLALLKTIFHGADLVELLNPSKLLYDYEALKFFVGLLSGLALIWLSFLTTEVHKFGTITALVVALDFGFMLFNRLDPFSTLFVFFTYASLVCFYLAEQKRSVDKKFFAVSASYRSSKWFLTSFIAMSCAFLAKGLVGILIPLLSIFAFLWFKKNIRSVISYAGNKFFIGALILFFVVCIWFLNKIFVYQEPIGQLIDTLIHPEFSSIKVSPWYFLFPWIFFLGQAIFSFRAEEQKTIRSERTNIADLKIFILTSIISVSIVSFFMAVPAPIQLLLLKLPILIIIATWLDNKIQLDKYHNVNNYDALTGFILNILGLIAFATYYILVLKHELIDIDPHGFFVHIGVILFFLLSSAFIASAGILNKPKTALGFYCLGLYASYIIFFYSIFPSLFN